MESRKKESSKVTGSKSLEYQQQQKFIKKKN